MKNNQCLAMWLFLAFAVLGSVRIFKFFYDQKKQQIATHTTNPIPMQETLSRTSDNSLSLVHHVPLQFNLTDKLKGFSKKQIEEHEQLYKGYVNKRNEIAQQLEAADRSKANNITFSPFRGLKLGETFAMNGDILHRLYFQNLGGASTMGKLTLQLIEENFGSLEKFKQDLFATAQSSRGWAITGYAVDEKRIHNYLLDAHNQTVPVLIIPLLILDVYEHAYMIDFGIKRISYLDLFWQNINWDVVEKRSEFIKKYADIWAEYFN